MYVVAGPNGAGKSTFTERAHHIFGLEPIDADAIQRTSGISSSAAWAEGLRRCRAAIALQRSFLVETTLAGRDVNRPSTYLNLMAEARAKGFRIDVTFIALENADAHVARVADRVAAGQHDIPEHTIRKRYALSLLRLPRAIMLSDHALVIDNSSATQPFREVAEFENGARIAVDTPLPTWLKQALGA
jgi:predicted ABC-type ATPase